MENRKGEIKPGDARTSRIPESVYMKELYRLQIELCKLQAWVREKNLRVVVVFEGRDAAGKGGVIRRIVERMNPRIAQIVALGQPTERHKNQWYFQRYAAHLPTGGEIKLFDRSWYNRAGVERVMGFCSDAQYWDFLREAPEFERMIVRSGTILIKYWFAISDQEQERRFQGRLSDPTKRWKLSPMDLAARDKWEAYSKAKDIMFEWTDTAEAPWYVVRAESKKRARLNCITHLLGQIDYEDLSPSLPKLAKRPKPKKIKRPDFASQTFVPEYH